MQILTAEDANAISKSNKSYELENIFEFIRSEAFKGKNMLHLFHNVSEPTIKELEKLGYKIYPEKSIYLLETNFQPKLSISW